jgi:hypothetical protein
MNRYALALLAFIVGAAGPSLAQTTVFRVEAGRNYDRYSNSEMRRRIWELERAVAQLQERVFQLERTPVITQPVIQPPRHRWTCRMQSFGDTHVATAESRGAALAQVLKACGDATNPIHCKESAVKCED